MGELEYIDNIDYGQDDEPSLDAMLEELAEATGRDSDAALIYEAIYAKAMRDIKVSDLAITRIMPDLIEMLQANMRKAMLVMRLLADPYASYSELGELMGYSKQRTHIILRELAAKYDWLERLLELHNA